MVLVFNLISRIRSQETSVVLLNGPSAPLEGLFFLDNTYGSLTKINGDPKGDSIRSLFSILVPVP